VAGHGLLSDYIANDGRFVKEIDDPKGNMESPPLQIISVPIMCNSDAFETPGNNALSNYPRCIV
jgi:hypothetical protein